MQQSAGIHHVTMIARKVQANVDFYAGFLGLRLVKQTAGFEDAMQLHLFYGDAAASPGSLLTFLIWEDGSPGRAGHGQVFEIALAIDPASIGFWLTRALSAGVRTEGPASEFGEPVIRLKDPDGIIVKLVGTTRTDAMVAPVGTATIPAEHAIRRIRGVTLLTEVPEQTVAFMEKHFAYQPAETEGAIRRMVSESGDVLDIRDAGGFWTSAPGTGTFDHVALRARDMQELDNALAGLRNLNSSVTNAHDRKYFHSLYVREPGGILIEMATDAPGMSVDESPDRLGETLFIPPMIQQGEDEARVSLPQFALPGEPRVIYRELPFVHRFHTPEDADGSVIILLHGTGSSESGLMPLAHKAAPRATLLGVRGRATEDGTARWFRRFPDLTFDQKDIRKEAEAFAAFLEGAVAAYGIDPGSLTFIGQSNGANFLAAFLALYPEFSGRAALLRPVPVLDQWPEADLSGNDMLILEGRIDGERQKTAELASILADRGATVKTVVVDKGHAVGTPDIEAIASWLATE